MRASGPTIYQDSIPRKALPEHPASLECGGVRATVRGALNYWCTDPLG
jgi:hypothetical protein